MYQELVIAVFVLLSLGGAMGGAGAVPEVPTWMPVEPERAWAVCLVPFVVLGGIGAWSSWRAVRQVDRGRVEAIGSLEATLVIVRVMGVVFHGVNCLVLGWPGLVNRATGGIVLVDSLIAAAPALTLIVAGWWWMEPVERRVRQASVARRLQTTGLDATTAARSFPSRAGYVWFWSRQSVLPVLLPLILISLWTQSAGYFLGERAGEVWVFVAQFLGVVALLGMGPILLRRVWTTERLGESSVRELLAAVCERSGVRVREFLLWRTGGTMHNAAVLGFFAPARYILVTDAMVESMPAGSLEAVASHEVGHVRCRHLMWLGLSTLSAVLLLGTAAQWVAWYVFIGVANSWELSEEAGRGASHWFSMGGMVLTLACVFVWFGWVSRRLEWQADAFAVKDLTKAGAGGDRVGSAAAGQVSEALGLVAMFNGLNPRRFSWRHGSIRTRQRRVEGLVGAPLGALPIDRDVRRIKVLTVLGLIVFAFLAAYEALTYAGVPADHVDGPHAFAVGRELCSEG
jgi:Zn-dependent protease with chaperone function